MSMHKNLLVLGDNLTAMPAIAEEYGLWGSIDLVYVDPPFATNMNFFMDDERANAVSQTRNGRIAYSDKLSGSRYLAFLKERIALVRELLSDRGSIYLHIDCKIGHYVKVMMDEIFGVENFRNDITRIKCNPKNFRRKGYGNMKDMILFYSKTDDMIWNDPHVPYDENDIARLFPKVDADGRRYTTVPIHAPGETANGESSRPFRGMLPPKGRHWRTDVATLERWDESGLIEWSKNGNPRKKVYADEKAGKRVQDIWTFKDPQYPLYPTEKNLEMLKLIVSASSAPDSIVMDCFCGSGTTLLAAQELGRRWIGIDESAQAIDVARKRLHGMPGDLFADATYDFLTI